MKRFWLMVILACILCTCFLACDKSNSSTAENSSLNQQTSISSNDSSSSMQETSENFDSSYTDSSYFDEENQDYGIPEYPDLELTENENENEDQWWKNSADSFNIQEGENK